MEKTFKPGEKLYDSSYIVEKIIGKGGDGSIYVVHQNNDPDTKYAAKVFLKPDTIDDNYWKKHSDEALTSLRISHRPNPNLAKTYDVIVTNDNDIILIMEYIDGVTLKQYLNKHGSLTPKVALNIFKKMLNGISQLHHYKQKIIHRDLKPENIMVSHDLSKVIIVDFGISSVIKEDINKVMTNEMELYGTASYILPDLYDEYRKKGGERNISVQSDFFSLGVILYEMLMGTLPFEPIQLVKDGNVVIGSDGRPSIDAVKTVRLPLRFDMINISANPTIPATLENIIFKCLASKPGDIKHRYTDIDQIIDDINNCIPLLDRKTDNTPLLKPVKQRIFQGYSLIDIDSVRQGQQWYKQWWFFFLIFAVAITITIVAIIFFFVI
ncbi:MAG: serine/threonine-protein kinase [Mycoplasmoidaceae bacterium]